MPQPSNRMVLAKVPGRSRLTNGHYLPRGVDLRSPWARRFRDLLVLHCNDKGGADACSEAERAIIRRVATLIVSMEKLEERFAQKGGASVDELDLYQRLANSMRRLLQSIGLERRAKSVNGAPNLREYIQREYIQRRPVVVLEGQAEAE